MDSTSVIHMTMKESVLAVLTKVKTGFTAMNAGVAAHAANASTTTALFRRDCGMVGHEGWRMIFDISVVIEFDRCPPLCV